LKDEGLERMKTPGSISKLWNGREYICFVCFRRVTSGGFRHIYGFTERVGLLDCVTISF